MKLRHQTTEDNALAVYPVSEEKGHAMFSDVCGCGVRVEEANGLKLFIHNEVRN